MGSDGTDDEGVGVKGGVGDRTSGVCVVRRGKRGRSVRSEQGGLSPETVIGNYDGSYKVRGYTTPGRTVSLERNLQ